MTEFSLETKLRIADKLIDMVGRLEAILPMAPESTASFNMTIDGKVFAVALKELKL